jgi:ABC-type sugar transport system ATPase subunit
MAAVELHALTRRYPGAPAEAVAGVDLAIREDERFVIVGPSASGKTTLLRMIAGLVSATSGEVRIGGRRMNEVAPRDRGVGMVFQHPALYPHLDVRANLTFGLRARGVPERESKERAKEVAGWLGVADLLDRRPKGLSGGERQRVALGRAVLIRPSVLLLDEPFSSLDPPLRASTRATVLDLHRRLGGTMILVTHDQSEALAVGERIAVMRGGKVEQAGTPRELYDRPANRFVAGFLGDPPMSFLLCRADSGKIAVPGGMEFPSHSLHVATAWLGLRPEAIAVDPVGEAAPMTSRVLATLERVEPRGHESIAWFRLDGHSLAVRAGPTFAGRPGESVTLGLDLSAAHWFATSPGEPRLA